jgi:Protein of unknown function (DUF3168)
MTRLLVKQATFAALSALPALGQRVYPVRMDQENTTFPACVYQLSGGTVDVTICGTAEQGDDVRVQVDLYSPIDGDLDTLRVQAIAAMEAVTLCPVHRAADNDLPFDEDARLYRRSIDFIFSLSNT